MTQNLNAAFAAENEFVEEPGLAELMGAYADGDIPKVWTPVHVGIRLVEAFGTLRRTPARIRPQAFGNGWPQIVQGIDADEEAILAMALATGQKATARSILETVNRETQAILRDDTDERLAQEAKRPTAQETSRADESLIWCFEHLREHPMQAGALQDWALCQAFELSAAKFLRKRAVAVDAAIADAEQYEKDCWERRRRSAAREIAAWANDEIEAGSNPSAIKAAAHGIMREAAIPIKIRRLDVLPDKCFTRSQMDYGRKLGALALAKALNRAGVPVR
jgi:hypothetical protein